MAWESLSGLRARSEPPIDEPDVAPEDDGHDPVLRYAALGIFLILFTAVLYVTRVIALPVIAGAIFGLVLGPATDRLVRHGVPQHLAAAILVLAVVALGTGAIGLLAVPLAAWSDQWPAMMAALQTKLQPILELVKQMEGALTHFSSSSGLEVNVANGSPLMHFAISSTTAMSGVLIFLATTYFYLATRRVLKVRILRLCLGGDVRKSASSFFNEIEQQVTAYLGVVTAINLGLGVAMTIIAWIAGLPFPIFWGAMAFLLNFLALIGPIVVAGLVFAAGLLTATTTLGALWPALVFYGLHLIESNALTPAIVGNRLTVPPFLVFLSLIFWLWLWGPVGAVLSTPLLLIAMVAIETIRDHGDSGDVSRREVPLSGQRNRSAVSALSD
ncbi:AI-2E family transporter [Phreatobacter aquaticus]|uniref:AI-2E family transporter n=1 Tax=Phreatobacter aquaticus TaxID=2570229 RepID=A0A4D7QLC5_9HYPH|nr:AI-2E family transporter [Phreatobacter aquaticus]QCK85072.1 AI-2E family transporter [Phreatobacter aquaticus]